jgi:hypothetical protein
VSRPHKVLPLLLFPLLSLAIARGSWLSDVTAINIDLAKSVGVVPHVLTPAAQPSSVIKLPGVERPVPVQIATADQRQRLQLTIDSSVQTLKVKSNEYASYAAASVFATIILGLFAAIAGFLKKAVAAGVLSLVVTASAGAAKAFPINDRASYYQTLYGEALSLQVQTKFASEMTVEDYNKYVARLTTILLYASKLPGVGDSGPVADELIKTISAK